MTSALATVRQLVEDFKAQEAAFLSPDYQESQVRQDFIDKFFTALGWDVTHQRQKNPYEQEVKIENKVNTQGSQRRADYAFFIAPNFRDVKFFAEAKKPHHDLANSEYYHQAIRYGWNQRTPIAVLTDFEEFHILDCRYKPDMKTALVRKIGAFHYTDYADEETFKRIFYLFGRDAVAAGSIEKFAADLPKPRGKVKQSILTRGYQAVDEAFLEALDGYRETLARSFKNNNPDLDGDELTEAVQRTLDRLVFMRFLEDKQIEDEAVRHFRGTRPLPSQRTVDAKGRDGEGSAWHRFITHSKSMEPKYNGLIFKPHRIIDSDDFVPPDDDQFATICNELSDPTSPYDFDKIPISILGSIYERFLGKVVRATDKRAKVEEKPEVRKAGGVYYTPEYIVRYIVKETVGKLIEGKTPDQIATMAFADIACGSGSFLLEVYSTLIEYHTRWYNDNPTKAKKADVETRDDRLVLSLKKTQEILTNNIYGVDIDFQATEVTQLSLYLRLLEDVTLTQLHLFKEKVLPDLRRNIVCGNSLIEPDIEAQPSLFESDAPSPRKAHSEPRGGTGRGQTPAPLDNLKPMRFTDAFPEVMKKGGFDAIVGNPPYGASFGKAEVEYFRTKYAGESRGLDSYELFLLRASGLLSANGSISMIIPASWLTGEKYSLSRKVLVNKLCPVVAYVLPFDVFEDAYIDTSIIVLEEPSKSKTCLIHYFPKKQKLIAVPEDIGTKVAVENIRQDSLNRFSVVFSDDKLTIVKKVQASSKQFGDLFTIQRGVQPYSRAKHTEAQIAKRYLHSDSKRSKEYLPELQGNELSRYWIDPIRKSYLKYSDEIASSRPRSMFEGERIVLRRLLTRKFRLQASMTNQTMITTDNVLNAVPKSKEVSVPLMLGILNSRFISWLYVNTSMVAQKDDFPQVHISALESVYLPPADKSRHDHIVSLVEQMLAAKEKLASAKTDAEVNRLEMQCESLDRQIDAAVYELYGLTKAEIEIVEKG